MLEIALSTEALWPDHDWDALASKAAQAAIALTPHDALADGPALVEISIRLTTDDEVQTLNRQYRQKDKPTNVLSFPMVQPDLLETVTQNSDANACGASAAGAKVLLGDIVLAHGVCEREATERNIAIETHATHLIVHGVLHLLGYDHIDDREAEAMEAIEIETLAALGIADPYLIHED